MRSSSSSVVLGVLLQQDDQRDFLRWFGNPSRVFRYTQGTWDLKTILVLSNAQPFKRGLLIYNGVRELPFYIPQGYMRGRYIYQWYMEEPHIPWDVV